MAAPFVTWMPSNSSPRSCRIIGIYSGPTNKPSRNSPGLERTGISTKWEVVSDEIEVFPCSSFPFADASHVGSCMEQCRPYDRGLYCLPEPESCHPQPRRCLVAEKPHV